MAISVSSIQQWAGEGYLERFQVSVKQLTEIAVNEATKPGRKLLIWVGPGMAVAEQAIRFVF